MALMYKILFSPKKRARRGFTLIEILVTIVILGVVAGLATPTYFASVEQSRANEAIVNLNTIYMGEKIYALNNLGYYWMPSSNPIDVASTNAALNIDIKPQFYSISIDYGNTLNSFSFKATAQRNATQGGNGTTKYTIDQTGTITPP